MQRTWGLVVLALGLAGCGGGSSKNNATTTTSTTSAGSTPAASASGSGSTPAPSLGGGLSALPPTGTGTPAPAAPAPVTPAPTAPAPAAPAPAAPAAPAPAGPGLQIQRLTVPGTRVRPGPIVGLTLRFDASGSAPVEVRQLTIASEGTVLEPDFLGGLRAVQDSNRNGVHDPGEPDLAALAAPAFAADDVSVTLTLSPPLVVTPGQHEQLLLLGDLLLPALNRNRTLGSLPGQTIVHALNDASHVVATSGGAPVTPSGRFPLQGVLVYQLADHVLLSEIGIGGGDYVELFNATPDVIDLSDYYVTDYQEAGGAGYHNLPAGTGFNPVGNGDFLYRFPPGASLRPGQTWVVALWGGAFESAFPMQGPPNLSAYDDVNVGIGILGMIAWIQHADRSNPPNWGRRALSTSGRFRRQGEAIVLFTWDGQSDKVQDVDMVAWGDAAPPGDARIDKTGLSVDGPDADTLPGTYLPETPAAQQSRVDAPGSFSARWALRRVDYLETGERLSGGNGINGNDETSEPWAQTWVLDYPDPWNP